VAVELIYWGYRALFRALLELEWQSFRR
jgi:hypothetical protein